MYMYVIFGHSQGNNVSTILPSAKVISAVHEDYTEYISKVSHPSSQGITVISPAVLLHVTNKVC